jgi:hypothetical protein
MPRRKVTAAQSQWLGWQFRERPYPGPMAANTDASRQATLRRAFDDDLAARMQSGVLEPWKTS